jgi:hypothetical protein
MDPIKFVHGYPNSLFGLLFVISTGLPLAKQLDSRPEPDTPQSISALTKLPSSVRLWRCWIRGTFIELVMG